MKNIVVTGGCGFIGSEVVSQLLAQGHRVRVLDNLSKPCSRVKQGYEFMNVDLTDKKAAINAFKGMDVAIHCAAKIGGIGYFHKFPATILSENNKLFSSVFEAAVAAKLERMVYVSSSMVFESTDKFPSLESDLYSIPPPVSAYGFSKLTGEWYCRAFFDEYALPYTICRPFNAYGINEHPGEEIGYAHVIPDLTKKILEGQYPVELLGDGRQTRCFTHVRDIARGIIMAAQSPKARNEDFNIGISEETRILDLAEKIWKLCEMKKPFEYKLAQGFTYDIRRRVPDSSKAERLLGWKPEIPFEVGLKEVISWLRRQLSHPS